MKLILASLFFAAALPMLAAAAPDETPTVVAGFIAETQGAVQVQLGGSDIWMLAKPGQRLTPGSHIKTQAGSFCVVGFTEGSKLRIGPTADFKLEETAPSKISVFIGLGKLECWVSKLAKRTFQARNPVAVASVRGTILVENVFSPTNATTDCVEGSLLVTDNFGHSTGLSAGHRMETSAAAGSSTPLPIPKTESKPIEPKVVVPEKIKEQVKTEQLKKPDDKKPEDKKPADKKPEDKKPADQKPPDEVKTTDQPPAPAPTTPTTSPTQETTTTPVSPSGP